MLASIIADIALFIATYFGDKAIDKTISLKKLFVIVYCLCLTIGLTLVFCYTDSLFTWGNILCILFVPLIFAALICLLAKWEMERQERFNNKI